MEALKSFVSWPVRFIFSTIYASRCPKKTLETIRLHMHAYPDDQTICFQLLLAVGRSSNRMPSSLPRLDLIMDLCKNNPTTSVVYTPLLPSLPALYSQPFLTHVYPPELIHYLKSRPRRFLGPFPRVIGNPQHKVDHHRQEQHNGQQRRPEPVVKARLAPHSYALRPPVVGD